VKAPSEPKSDPKNFKPKTVAGHGRADEYSKACVLMEPKPDARIPGGDPQAWLEGVNRALLDSALDCIITMDANGRVLEFNPAAERVFGFTREEALGKELAELIIPVSLRERHHQGLKHYLETGDGPLLGRRIEVNALRADRSEILVELAITAFRVQEKPYFTAYLRDITRRKEADNASRQLAAIIESSEDAIVSKDLDGRIVSWNTAAERLFGYKPEEIIGKSVTVLIPEDRQNEEPGILERIRRGQRIEHYETVRQRKDGTLFDISLTVSPIKDAAGQVIGASKIGRDITKRVRDEKRRAAQHTVASLLAGSLSLTEIGPLLIHTIADGGDWSAGSIWLCDDNCSTLHCATTWHTGRSQLEKFAEVTRATSLISPAGLPGRVVTSGKPVWIDDVQNDNDFPRQAAASAAGLRGAFAFPFRAHSKIKGVLELFSPQIAQPDEDLFQVVEALGNQIGLFVHRQQVQDELQRQKEVAETANAAKDRFLATLSHELRTPLTPILIWAGGMANDPNLTPEIAEGLEMVCRNVELEARLIDDLLDLTRIARGKLRLDLRKSDAHDLLGHAMEIVRDEISSRQLRVSVELEADRHHVIADSPRLQQVFWNVLKNASKFTPDHGAVTVRTSNPNPKALQIEISDTGVGIEPEHLDKIFDAFEQLGPRREGLGLGLAISRAIVEMHRGSIHAYSQGAGKGAKFVIDLETARDAA
jgi:two-component system CheB/CheR fusion protein